MQAVLVVMVCGGGYNDDNSIFTIEKSSVVRSNDETQEPFSGDGYGSPSTCSDFFSPSKSKASSLQATDDLQKSVKPLFLQLLVNYSIRVFL